MSTYKIIVGFHATSANKVLVLQRPLVYRFILMLLHKFN